MQEEAFHRKTGREKLRLTVSLPNRASLRLIDCQDGEIRGFMK